MDPERVRRLRVKLGASQVDLAALLRLGPGGKRTISRWEAGETIPGPATVALEALEAGWLPGHDEWRALRDHYLQCLDKIQEVVTQAREGVGGMSHNGSGQD